MRADGEPHPSARRLRPSRGSRGTVAALQQFFSSPEAGDLIAAVKGCEHSTVDLTAGDGSLLMGVEPDFPSALRSIRFKANTYTPIHGDLQRAYPLLRLLRAQFPRVA